MCELGEEHRGQMSGGVEAASLPCNIRLSGKPVDLAAWNEDEKLVENAHIGSGCCCLVHNTPTEWQDFQLNTSPLLLTESSPPVGCRCIEFTVGSFRGRSAPLTSGAVPFC
jgi:hypothetical protein